MIAIHQSIASNHKLDRVSVEKALEAAWAEAGELWAKSILPKHFRASAQAEYGYSERSAAYNAYKQSKKGHRRPLVFSGDLERSLKGGHRVKAKAKGSKKRGAVRIHMSGPFYLRFGKGKQLMEEIRAVSNRDERALAEVLDRVLQKKLNETGATRSGHRR